MMFGATPGEMKKARPDPAPYARVRVAQPKVPESNSFLLTSQFNLLAKNNSIPVLRSSYGAMFRHKKPTGQGWVTWSGFGMDH